MLGCVFLLIKLFVYCLMSCSVICRVKSGLPWQNSNMIVILSLISALILHVTVGNVLLMSKDDMHLQQEQFSNIIRTVRSKVGQPNVYELWEGAIGNNGDYSSDLNRIRRSIVEIHEKDKLNDGSRKTKSLYKQAPDDIPVNDLQQEPRQFNDQIHVVSSAIRVLSKKEDHGKEGVEQIRQKRNEWRRPRTQFVTRTERMSPLGPRYQFPPERSDRYLLDNEITPGYRRTNLPQRRIIYYATLPEIVRRPPVNNEWPQQQQLQYTSPLPSRQQPVALESRPYYPLMRDNEVTRVQSSVIDVTNRDPPASPSQTPTIISSVLASPKYTIIDAEPPPYVRPYYNNYPYNVRYPQPYYNYNSNNRYYYDDIRTPPYRIQQTFQPPYYNKPEYVPVELPTSSPTAPSGPSSSQESIVDSNLQQISTTNSTIKASDKTDKHSDNSNLNSINSRYI